MIFELTSEQADAAIYGLMKATKEREKDNEKAEKIMKARDVLIHQVQHPVRKTFCWRCSHEMIWGGDFSYEDYGLDGEGVISNHSCPNCGASMEFYAGEDDECGEYL